MHCDVICDVMYYDIIQYYVTVHIWPEVYL